MLTQQLESCYNLCTKLKKRLGCRLFWLRLRSHERDSQLPIFCPPQRLLESSVTALVERVGSCAPVSEKHAEADSLEDAADNGDGDSIQRALLSGYLCDDLET